MQGTNFVKIGRLMAGLIRTPQYTPGYLLTNFLRRALLDLQLPWFSYAAIDFLKSLLRPEMDVFEYGSGGSTLFFAKRVRTVTTTEDNVIWLEKVRERLVQNDARNITLQHRQFDTRNPIHFTDSSYLHSIPDREFDVIVIDGTEEYIGQPEKPLVRPICFGHAEQFVRPGGIIVVDDSWFYPELRRENRALRYRVLKSVGPARPGVTSTDIFFY
jgi:predicted O-methyltransferase YrrM